MKKVLVTGAAGSIGIKVIKYLLSEGKYEITALDLRNKINIKNLKRYRRRINIIYGDMSDIILMDALIKDQDYVIHLAGVMPPLADIKRGLCHLVDYKGTENIIRAINAYNNNCMMFYASTTTIYGDVKVANVKNKANITNLDYYSTTKLEIENLIKEKLKKYTIIRLPLVLSELHKNNNFMYNVKRDTIVEAITDNDAAYLFVNALNFSDKLNKKIYNAGGGTQNTASYRDLLINILKIYGFSFKYLGTLLFVDKNFYVGTYEDSDKLNEILDYRSDSLSSYYMRLKRHTKKRQIARFFAKPFIFVLKRKNK